MKTADISSIYRNITWTVYVINKDDTRSIRFIERLVSILIRRNNIQKSLFLNLKSKKTNPSNMRVRISG
jgi:hypothetical protein